MEVDDLIGDYWTVTQRICLRLAADTIAETKLDYLITYDDQWSLC
jgi:hypothetical protein